MQWEEWRFSVQRAWQDPLVKWTMIGTVLFYILFTSFSLSRLLPTGLRSGFVSLHYTIYLGIDEVRPWPWAFFAPAILLLLVVTNGVLGCLLYRVDPLAAKTLLLNGAVITIVWGMSSFFLASVNF